MKLPVGFNPHLLPKSEQQTTRAAISTDNAGEENVQRLNAHGDLEAETRRLDAIVQQTLGTFSLDLPRRKRRKLESEASGDDFSATVAPFRLVSSALPPQAISLVPVYHKAVSHQRPSEDTKREGRLRRERAQQVAVDAEWIFKQSHLLSNVHRGRLVESLWKTETDTHPSQLPNLLVTERALPRYQTANSEGTATKSVNCCTLIPVKESPLPSAGSKRRRRKRTTPPRERPHPNFFRPALAWGGKSAGYAMGWNGSHPVNWTGSRHYIRDTMSKGVTLSLFQRMG